jgi:hypothetical protein
MLSSPPLSPLIAVLHSGEVERNAYLMPRLQQLAQELQGEFVAIDKGLRKQPTTLELIRGSFSDQAFKQDWSGQPAQNAWVHIRQVADQIYRTARSLRHDLKPENVSCFTKAYNLLSKHHQAWQKLLAEPDDRVLLVFENDARFKPTTTADLSALLAVLALAQPDFIFCDLAGGVNPSSLFRGELLHPDAWVDQVDLAPSAEATNRCLAKLSKFVTNTTCAYLINKKVAEVAVQAFGQLRTVHADYFLNYVLTGIDQQTTAITCYHAVPPIFEHGSLTGAWQSTISPNWELYQP